MDHCPRRSASSSAARPWNPTPLLVHSLSSVSSLAFLIVLMWSIAVRRSISCFCFLLRAWACNPWQAGVVSKRQETPLSHDDQRDWRNDSTLSPMITSTISVPYSVPNNKWSPNPFQTIWRPRYWLVVPVCSDWIILTAQSDFIPIDPFLVGIGKKYLFIFTGPAKHLFCENAHPDCIIAHY